jgi:predicted CXXCH cytochrome family protein
MNGRTSQVTLIAGCALTAWLVAAPLAFAQHPELEGATTTNDGCLECHDDVKAAMAKAPHKAIEAGCQVCHDVAKAKASPYLRGEVNALCIACHHQPTLLPGSPVPAKVAITADYSIAGTYLPRVRQINLDRRGVGHPVVNHPVAGVKDPLKDGRDLSCVSCHVPHGTESPKLLAFNVKSGMGICQECHKL